MIIAGAHNAAVLDMCVLVCVQEHPKCIIYICVHEVWYSVRSLYRWNRPFERNENYLFDCFVDFTACRVAVQSHFCTFHVVVFIKSTSIAHFVGIRIRFNKLSKHYDFDAISTNRLFPFGATVCFSQLMD